MKIQVPVTHYEEVTLTEQQLKDITAKYIRKICKLPDHPVIKEGVLYGMEEYYTSHSWTELVKVSEATELDKAAIIVLQEMLK